MADTQTGVGVVVIPPNVINLNEIKQLQLNSLEDVVTATKALSKALAEKREELLFEKQSVTLKLTSGVFSLPTTNEWWDQDVVDNPDKFLLTTDFTHFIEQLDLWLIQHSQEILSSFEVQILPEQFPFTILNNPYGFFKELDLTINSSQVDFNLLEKVENIAKIREAFKQTNLIVSSLVVKTPDEKGGQTKPTSDDAVRYVGSGSRAVTTAGVKPPVEEGGGTEDESSDQAQVLEDQSIEAERLQRSFAGDSIEAQALRRATNHEFSWIYNHVLFDLMGRHGIQPNDLIMNELTGIVRTHLASLPPDQIRNLFANPALRLAEVRNVYLKLASQPVFIRELRAQYESHLAAVSDKEKTAFIASTGFDTLDEAGQILIKRDSILKTDSAQIEAFKQSPTKQAETSLANITGITIDGANAVNFERAVTAVTQAMGSRDIAQDLGLQYPENKADLTTFVKKLSAEQLVLIFFANPNNPNAVEGTTLTAVSQNIEKIRALLTTALLATSIDKVVDSATELKKLLGVLESADENPSDAEVESLVASVQTLTGSMPVGNKQDEVGEALTTDERKSHTQELMEQYQKRVHKIWLQLDEETQLQAYFKLYNMVPSPENKMVLLDKVQHLRDPETNSLPWNPNLF
ncbi:hypothetical protein KBC89_01830, partial [Candidatus Woesebacteria bacterium]|nr:hypothetical protein [Candidatus Woesebacteria bacterium]